MIPAPTATAEPLLSVEDLSIAYRSGDRVHEVVRGISFSLGEGEVLGLAGESGCGKSTLARAAMGWLANNAFAPVGDVRFRGESLLAATRVRLRALWGRELAYIPQEVSTGLNPSRRVGNQLREVLELHSGLPGREHRAAIEEALDSVGIDAEPQFAFALSLRVQRRSAAAHHDRDGDTLPATPPDP